LCHFFAWNEAARVPDCRYVIACDIHRLLTGLGGKDAAREICLTHLALRPVILFRLGNRVLVSKEALAGARRRDRVRDQPAITAGRQLIQRLHATIGSVDEAAHAAVFDAFEGLADQVDLRALARVRPRLKAAPRRASPDNILVIRLSALGDFIQSLGCAAAIRRRHAGGRITLLTTASFAELAAQLELFDAVLIDHRPKPFALAGWLALSRVLRQGRFDRVYDLQTSWRSGVYSWLFGLWNMPEWSGIAWRCSHPHANLDRDQQHTIERQAEQLLMAGVYPTPLPGLPLLARSLPGALAGVDFVILVPGSSPRHLAKRWPAARYGVLARALLRAGYTPVVVGSNDERPLGAAVLQACPKAVDLVGRTDIGLVAALARRAVLTIGNDTGVSHLAAAAGSPVVALFSHASDPARCAPRGRVVRVLTAPDLNDLDVEVVLAEAMALVGHCPGSAQREASTGVADGMASSPGITS
jgi:ADP-heptose:LPS heptosyltransferase